MERKATKTYFSLMLKVILIMSTINAIYNELWHLMSTNIFLLVLITAPQIIKKYEIKVPSEFEWALLIFAILSLFLGKISGIIVPIFFGIAIAFIGFLILAILYSSNQIKKNPPLIILFSFNLTVTIGFALELLKYYIKVGLGHELTSGTYQASMQNMTFVIIGAIIASIMGYVYMTSQKGIIRKIIGRIVGKNPKLFSNKEKLTEEVLETISKGESGKLEFKQTLRQNIHTGEHEKKIEHATLKTITAFLNTKGGTLIIGLKDNKEISGIEKDKFENKDKFMLHLTNIIKQRIGKKHLNLIKTEIINIKGKDLALIEVKPNRDQAIFLKNLQNEDEFYIRTGNSTTQLKARDMVDYINRRFKKKS